MVMQILTKCGRCGALVEPNQMPSVLRGTNALFWRAATTCNVDASGTIAMDFADTTALCPDCIGQLKGWLAGEPEEPQKPQASADSVAALVRDMAAALDFSRDSAWPSCRYFYHSADCNGCPADSSDQPCFHVLFDDIHRRCKALEIDLEEEADAKRWQGQPEQAD